MRTPLRTNLLFLFAISCIYSPLKIVAQLNVKTEIYPGVELLNVIHLLSDSAETVPSTYANDVRKHFAAFKDHPAVIKARTLDLLNCDFPLRHSWCFYNFPDIKLHLPDTLWAYNKYVSTTALREYFLACTDFYKKSKFWDFYTSYQPNYEKWKTLFKKNLYDECMLASIDDFYKLKPSNKVTFTLGAMNCNSFALPETGEINPAFHGTSTIFIAYGNLYKSNDSTPPYFYSKFNSQLIWHEAGHVYLADLFKKHSNNVDAIRGYFDGNDSMQKIAGPLSWSKFLDENITQAVTSYLRIQTNIVTREREMERLTGFNEMAKIIIDIIEEKYALQTTYPNFDEFFPVLLQDLQTRLTNPQ